MSESSHLERENSNKFSKKFCFLASEMFLCDSFGFYDQFAYYDKYI